MEENKWQKFWNHKEWTPGKEETESREHLNNFLDALSADVKSGDMFKRGMLSIKNLVLPNGYIIEFSVKQGVALNQRHEWAEPKASRSMTERKIRRCIHCRRAFANRIANARCVERR